MPILASLQALDETLDRIGSALRSLSIEPADLAGTALAIAMIWVLAWIGFRVLNVVAKRIVATVDDGDGAVLSVREKRGHTIAQLVRSAGKVLILVMAIMLTLAEFIEIGPLLAGAGVAGLAISFGAQSLVKDVIAGFFIIFEDQFTVGDVVEVGGRSGVVERISLRVVQIRDLEGILHLVPNGQIDVVSNKTRGWSRAVVEVGVGYGEQVDRALDVFRDEAAGMARDPEWKGRLDGTPEVWGVEKLDDSAVVIRTVLRTIPGQQWTIAREFRRRIKNRLDRESIEIPFPQRTVHMRERPAAE